MNYKAKNRSGTKKWSKRYNILSAWWFPKHRRMHYFDKKNDKDIKDQL